MRGDTNFKGSELSDPTVYSLYCGLACAVDRVITTPSSIRQQESKFSIFNFLYGKNIELIDLTIEFLKQEPTTI